jgi:hypothetical protein
MAVSEAVGQLAGAVREVLGLTRHSRLRHQLDDTLDLYAKAKKEPELSEATALLALAIQEQSRQLLLSLLPRKQLAWTAFLGASVVVAVAAAVDWVLWHFKAHLWARIPFYSVAAFGGLVLLLGLIALFSGESAQDADGDEQPGGSGVPSAPAGPT